MEKISNRATIRVMVEQDGPDKAIKWGIKQGMREETVYAYVTDWIKIKDLKVKSVLLKARADARAAKKAERKGKVIPKKSGKPADAATAPKKTKETPPTFLYKPDYIYASMPAAKQAREYLCKRMNAPESLFRIMRKGERFAIAPKHYQSDDAPPTFKKGQRVMGLGWKCYGVVKDAGPQQSIIDWESGHSQLENNHYLIAVEEPEVKAKAVTKATTPRKTRKAK